MGVGLTCSGTATFSSDDQESSELVLRLEAALIGISGLGSSVKTLVVTQKRKLPKMLPWGEPPGTDLGTEHVYPIFTDILRPNRKAADQSTEISDAPRSVKASKHA